MDSQRVDVVSSGLRFRVDCAVHCLRRLDFVVKYTRENHPDVASKFLAELEHVGRGAKVAYSNIAVELSSLERSLKATQTKLTKVKDVAGKLYAQLQARVEEYSVKIQQMGEKVKNMEAARKEVLVRFGEDPKSGELGELFQSVVDFISSWEAAASLLDAEAKTSGSSSGHAGGSSDSGSSRDAAGQALDGNKLEHKLADMKAGTFRRRAGSAVGATDAVSPATEDRSARQKELERERLRRR